MGRTRLRAVARVACAFGMVALVALLNATPASAHASLLETTPIDGTVLTEAPGVVRLRFNQSVGVRPGAVRVLNTRATEVQNTKVRVRRDSNIAELEVGLRSGLADGTYVVTWRVTSADGHPIAESFVFSIGAPSPVNTSTIESLSATPDVSDSFKATTDAVRTLMYIGALIAAGGVLFLLRVHDGSTLDRARVLRVVRAAALLGIMAAMFGVAFQAGAVTGSGFDSLTDGSALGDVIDSNYGTTTLMRVVGLCLVFAGTVLPSRLGSRRLMALVSGSGAALVVVAFVTSGHATTGEPRWLVVVSGLVHAAAAAAWIGGLALLALCLHHRRAADDAEGAGTLVVRFSYMATVAILAVGAAGLALAWAQVRTFDGLSSGYGSALLIKVAFVAVVAGLGLYNRTVLVPRLRHAPASGRFALLRRTIAVECVVLVAVLGTTAALVTLEPPRDAAAAEVSAEPFRGVKTFNEGEVVIRVDPARVGTNIVTARFTGPDGRPIDPGSEVNFELSLTAREVAPIVRPAVRTGVGAYELRGPELSLPGRWTIEVQALIEEFTSLAQDFTVRVS